jgi:hypothetical protein
MTLRLLIVLLIGFLADCTVGDVTHGGINQAETLTALATIALAAITAAAVWQTNLLLRGEERRAQQRLAPYLTADFSTESDQQDGLVEIVGFAIKNSGYGLAQNVSVNLEAYTTHYEEGDTWATRLERAASRGDKLFRMHVRREVVAVNESVVAFLGEQGPLKPLTVVARARIQYFDSFGNFYETIYDDWHEKRSRWIQPPTLQSKQRPPRGQP